ncbi:HIT domain-containing protein [Candidatus Saccharibacteria bacterium]|nr:HIT domain-containing protein [Candidatus Saccharibacteria bacterium]
MTEQCIFCDEHKNNTNSFAETDLWRARWDGYPATPGHAELLPKRHAQYLEELTSEEMATMMSFARNVIRIIAHTDLVDLYEQMLQTAANERRLLLQAALDAANVRPGAPDGFNFGINDGPEAGQSVYHLHLHVMPRWKGDAENPRGGVRNLFQNDTYKDL